MFYYFKTSLIVLAMICPAIATFSRMSLGVKIKSGGEEDFRSLANIINGTPIDKHGTPILTSSIRLLKRVTPLPAVIPLVVI